ncbi:MAG TPA: carbohydrate-binding module family 20 domain-containing protein, partial [Verrucomicrobiae bacterium]
MEVTFRIGYYTRPGQSLWLAGSAPLPPQPAPMQFADAEHWQVTLSLPTDGRLNYGYILRQPDGTQIADWGRDRHLVLHEFAARELLVLDSWNQPGYIENVFYTAPFQKVFLAENPTETKPVALAKATHTFRVKAPLLKKNETLCLLGECATLGYWNTRSAVLLGREQNSDYFSVALDLRGETFPIAYKYGVFDLEKHVFLRYEDGANRVLWDEIKRDRHTVAADGFARLPLEPWRGAGV